MCVMIHCYHTNIHTIDYLKKKGLCKVQTLLSTNVFKKGKIFIIVFIVVIIVMCQRKFIKFLCNK